MSTTITYTQFTDGVFGEKYRLAFKYDRETIETIKTIPGKFYDPASKTWSVPVDQLDALRNALPNASFIESGLQTASERPALVPDASAAHSAGATRGQLIAAKLRELADLIEGVGNV